MKNLEMKNFIGRKYGSLTDEEKNFIETKITGTVVQENGMELKRRNGDCIIDFEDNISIAGKIEDTEDQIIETIEDNAVFYDSRG